MNNYYYGWMYKKLDDVLVLRIYEDQLAFDRL